MHVLLQIDRQFWYFSLLIPGNACKSAAKMSDEMGDLWGPKSLYEKSTMSIARYSGVWCCKPSDFVPSATVLLVLML